MRIDIRACADLVDELVEDGLICPPPQEPNWLTLPLQLSDIGDGYIAWVESSPT